MNLSNKSELSAAYVTIDDQGMVAGSGLNVALPSHSTAFINGSSNVNINAVNTDNNGNDSLTFQHFYQSTLVLDSNGEVDLTAATQITFRNSMTVGNSESTGAWVVTAPTVQFNDGATLNKLVKLHTLAVMVRLLPFIPIT